MKPEIKRVLTINGGSSSIKFCIYAMGENPEILLSGKIDRMGLNASTLSFDDTTTGEKDSFQVAVPDSPAAVAVLISWLKERKSFEKLKAVGHRIVHGMDFTEAQIITDELLAELQKISSYDPDHLPGEIELIKAFRKKLPGLPQIACFDTSFHTTIPRLARILPIPRKYTEQGIRKYGFHGLSYSYILEELNRMGVVAAKKGRVIIAHLGNGASMAAVLNGISVDTSMGFTPAGGLVMGTRPGDLDPGLSSVIMAKESLSAKQFNDLVNHQCGLLGMSETSPDMQDLLKKENSDIRASEAIGVFCYQAKKWIGSLTTVLQGLDALVFTGGIGEHAASVRARICAGLEFMGIELDEDKNQGNAVLISSANSRIAVYAMATHEELMIAKLVTRVLSK
jgi:acetate kinase